MAEIKGITPVCPRCGWEGAKNWFTGDNTGTALGVKCHWCKSDYRVRSLDAEEEQGEEWFTLQLTEEEDEGLRRELAAVIKYTKALRYMYGGNSVLPIYYLEKLLHAMENPEG